MQPVFFLGCKYMLPGCVELLIHRYPQILLSTFSDQPVLVFVLAMTHTQDFVFVLVELHEVCTGFAPLKAVKVLLDSIPSLNMWTTSHSLVESALIFPVGVSDRGAKHFSCSEVESNFGCNWMQPFQAMLLLFDPNTVMHKAAIVRVA